MSIKPAISFRASAGEEYIPFLRRKLNAAWALLPAPPAELSIALVGNAMMSKLHHRYLGRAVPTDVLSFELDHDQRGLVTAGEVVVCVSHARRLARGRGVAVRDELLLYALHGLLHLSGFDDKNDLDFAAMHRFEDQILIRIGVGKVFQTRPLSPPRIKASPRQNHRGR